MGLVNDASEPGCRLCMNVLRLICIAAFFSPSGSPLCRTLSVMYCRSQRWFSLWLSRYQSNCSSFHLSPLKVSFVHQPPLCQYVNIISDIDTDLKDFLSVCMRSLGSLCLHLCQSNDLLSANTGKCFPFSFILSI